MMIKQVITISAIMLIYYNVAGLSTTNTELADIHYKTVIHKRNQWIVDNSSVIIGYIKRDCGGAYKALKYAEKQKKYIVFISNH